jgi:hypothetical protein
VRGRSGGPAAARPSTARAPVRGGPAAASSSARGTARPGTASGATARRSTSRAGAPAAPAAEAAPESFTAAQLRSLESEVAHLRETIDVLLAARGVPSSGAVPPPVFRRGATTSPSAVRSGLRSSEGTLSSPSRAPTAAERAAFAAALHEENKALVGVDGTLKDKRAHDTRVVALQKESRLLQDPRTLAAAARPG